MGALKEVGRLNATLTPTANAFMARRRRRTAGSRAGTAQATADPMHTVMKRQNRMDANAAMGDGTGVTPASAEETDAESPPRNQTLSRRRKKTADDFPINCEIVGIKIN